MTGITGGAVDEEQLKRMVKTLGYEEWYESERFEADQYALGSQHHGEKDPLGHTFWTDGHTAGVIDGTVSNITELGWDWPAFFERFLRAPERTLETIDGSFSVACVNAETDRFLLGTDKIGSRPCYYTTENGFVFGSGLAPLLEVIDEPALDKQGVSDLLLMGHMWSDTTLLEGVKSLRPGTILEYNDDEMTERRYWHPDFSPAKPTEEYHYKMIDKYRQTVDKTARTLTGDVGLWLSGGLDSRATINELARNQRKGNEFESLTAYTYDANPGGGVNPRIAREVAEVLELPIENVPLTPDAFLPNLERAIDITDGMVTWNTLLNLSAVFNIEQQDPNILMEGIIGELLGQHLGRYHLTESSSLVQSMYKSEARLSIDDVNDLMGVHVDPLGSFRREAHRTNESSFVESVVDVHFQNYYPRLAHASNPLPRSQVGTRIPYADGDFLSHAAKLPLSYRMGALPFSDGELIYGVVKPKIRLMRALNAELAEIPYERSRLKPSLPYPLHVAGFFISTAIGQLRSQQIYGGKSKAGQWYRSHEGFQQRLNELLTSATKRSFFDDDAIRERQERHLRGESEEMNVLGPITTLEIWLQRHLD